MKKVLITGGATGIGKKTASLFIEKGYDVYITYNKTLPIDTRVNAIKCDLKNEDEIKALFDKINDIDILVNNAGISLIKQINFTTVDELDNILNVNLRAVFLTCKEATKMMIKNHRGSIINVSSIWGVEGASCEVAYSATKSGVIGLTKALSKELAPSNINVNCVAPGIIDTRMNECFSKEELINEVPLGRLGTPKDVANAIYFFSQNEYITGQVLTISGGF